MQVISPPSGVKSVQRGYTTVANALQVTVSPVNMSKSFLSVTYVVSGSANSVDSSTVAARLTAPDKVDLNRGSSSGSAYVAWELIENA